MIKRKYKCTPRQKKYLLDEITRRYERIRQEEHDPAFLEILNRLEKEERAAVENA